MTAGRGAMDCWRDGYPGDSDASKQWIERGAVVEVVGMVRGVGDDGAELRISWVGWRQFEGTEIGGHGAARERRGWHRRDDYLGHQYAQHFAGLLWHYVFLWAGFAIQVDDGDESPDYVE